MSFYFSNVIFISFIILSTQMFDARDGEFNLENVKGQLCIPVNLFTILFFV